MRDGSEAPRSSGQAQMGQAAAPNGLAGRTARPSQGRAAPLTAKEAARLQRVQEQAAADAAAELEAEEAAAAAVAAARGMGRRTPPLEAEALRGPRSVRGVAL